MQEIQEMKEGAIYMVCSKSLNKSYIGSTTHFDTRLSMHKSAYKNYINKNIGHYYTVYEVVCAHDAVIVKLETVRYITNRFLRSREAHYIQTIPCVNKNVPRTSKQYYQDKKINYQNYYLLNRVKLINYQIAYNNRKKNI